MPMQPFNKKTIEFLKSYNYKVKVNDTEMLIINKDYRSKTLNIVMVIFGLLGIPICFAGSYQIGIVFLLLLAFPIIRLVNGNQKKIVFNLLNQRIQGVNLTNIKKFQFNESEAFAHASPFEEGTIEYTLKLEMVNNNDVLFPLLSFVDRKKKKPDAEQLLIIMNNWL